MEFIEKSAPPSASPFNALFRLFYEPASTFAALAARRATWIPVLAVTAANAGLLLWYFLRFVDYAWFQEDLLSSLTDPVERQQQELTVISQQAMGIMSAIGGVVALVGSYAISGLYLMMVGKIKNQECSFSKGFSLSAWASVPLVLLLPLGATQMLFAAHHQVPLEALNPTTLNQLLFQLEASHPFAGLLESLSVLLVWNLALLVIGYQAWTGTARGPALRIVLLPYALIYGIWLAYALSRTV
jgi:hypothetical protein